MTFEQPDWRPIDAQLLRQAEECMSAARQAKITIATVESCTAGLLAATLSDAPGSAEHLQGGFIVYTEDAKQKILGLSADFLASHSVVSAEVAVAMAEAGLKLSSADVAVSVTGVTGPETDDEGNPIGLVRLACAGRAFATVQIEKRFGDIGRGRVRYATIQAALSLLGDTIRKAGN